MARSPHTPPPPMAAHAAGPPPARPRRLGPGLPLALLGFALVLGAWYLTVDVLALPRFSILPGPSEVLTEWTSRDPAYGVSIWTSSYYADIWASLRRVLIAFFAALALGVPLGLWMGWSRR